ncbi:GNAT family N-acetyltransferase [Brevibacillus daliensis]|uniref:GNAT family N-acetyltransferase n=1 Tax=Brevibacillus daliensis TaxID=2892995 RepID=UPI001E48C736|nr:GNAT family N-acetyltransferase [Brevibacillus daliensis]
METIQLVEVNHELLEGMGSFCLRSKQTSKGYINKNKWLHNSFEEGLTYVKLLENKKTVGFIEYIEAEFSSRVVHANNYLVIHCLWVSSTGKGYGTKLITKCLEDAKRLNKHGVVVVSNSDTSWAASKEIFLKRNFSVVDKAPYGFELLVYKFDDKPDPYFPIDWEERLAHYNNLTIIRTFQCPYVQIATENIVEGATKLGINVDIIDMKGREELMRLSPTPYGIFSAVYKGQLITFHRMTVHSVIKSLKELN